MSTLAARPRGAERTFRGRSPEERREERRARFVVAGLEVFGTRGFHRAGVRELCAEAKLTERYFYESFENREALFLAVYDDAVARVRTAIARVLAKSPAGGPAVARAGLSVLLEMLRDDPRLARVLLVDVLAIGESAGERSLLATRSFADLVAAVTTGAHPDLGAKGRDARLIANGLVGSTLFIAMQWAQGGFREPLARILDHAALFYEAVADAMGATSAPSGERSRSRRARR